jgi:hypothetical protein
MQRLKKRGALLAISLVTWITGCQWLTGIDVERLTVTPASDASVDVATEVETGAKFDATALTEAGTPDAASTDADPSLDAQPDTGTCPSAQGRLTNAKHCGACNHACLDPNSLCINGLCTPTPIFSLGNGAVRSVLANGSDRQDHNIDLQGFGFPLDRYRCVKLLPTTSHLYVADDRSIHRVSLDNNKTVEEIVHEAPAYLRGVAIEGGNIYLGTRGGVYRTTLAGGPLEDIKATPRPTGPLGAGVSPAFAVSQDSYYFSWSDTTALRFQDVRNNAMAVVATAPGTVERMLLNGNDIYLTAGTSLYRTTIQARGTQAMPVALGLGKDEVRDLKIEGRYAYVSMSGNIGDQSLNGKIVRVDLQTNETLTLANGNFRYMDIALDADYLYFSENNPAQAQYILRVAR